MNDIDRLETNIVDLQKAVHLISDRLSVQSQDMAALRKRIEALESQPRIVTAGSQDDDRVSPAPPAPLVERMLAAFYNEPGSMVAVEPFSERRMIGMRAALLVAAEELLGPVSGPEEDKFVGPLATHALNAVLESRLARAKEAARG